MSKGTFGSKLRRSAVLVVVLAAGLGLVGPANAAGAAEGDCNISNFTSDGQVNTTGYLIDCVLNAAPNPDPAPDCPTGDERGKAVADPFEVAPGATTTFSAFGFAPSSSVEIFICSTPISLGTFTTDGFGNIVQAVTIPTGVSLGAHTLAAVGTNPAGRSRVAYAATSIVGSALPTQQPTTTTGTLPRTGSDSGQLVAVAGALILLGGVALFGSLRSRRSATV